MPNKKIKNIVSVTKRRRSTRHRRQQQPRKKATAAEATQLSNQESSSTTNDTAEIWGRHLQQVPTYLTKDKLSWYIHIKKWMPTPSQEAFEREWALHPSKRHKLKVFGREIKESRWSQSWGINYAYSGAVNMSRPIPESTVLPDLIKRINLLHTEGNRSEEETSIAEKIPYNGCLQNWYAPEDKIGLHSDDERSQLPGYPIWSLSWGGTRRFLFRQKTSKKKPTPAPGEKTIEIWLEDGDLLLMGGTCQQTHKHEVPKLRVTRDPPTSNRINWTIRAFRKVSSFGVV